MKQKSLRLQRMRGYVQMFFFLWVVLVISLSEAIERGLSLPFALETVSLHAICPFGGIVTLWNLLQDGLLIRKIHESSVVLASLSVILAIGFGPVICSWVCPFGTFQEWIGKIGRRISPRRYNTFVPKKLDRYLRFLRYGVLLWVLVMTALSATLIFQPYDPYYALFSIIHRDLSLAGLVILLVIVLLSLFVERPFCKYACPYGAFLGLFNKIRIFKIRRDKNLCIGCNACNRACPMNIDVASSQVVTSHQCISCMACTSEHACPVGETVVVSSKLGTRRISTKTIAIITLVVFLGGILLSMVFGLWNTTGSKQPALVKEGAFTGAPNPADIRGSYTFGDVAEAFPVPLASLVSAFDGAEETMRLGSLEELWYEQIPEGTEVGTDSIRLFVSLYTGIPYLAEEGTLLPLSAVQVLELEGKSVDPRFAEIKDHAVSFDLDTSVIPTVPQDMEITGKTTVKEVLDRGISLSLIEELLGSVDTPSASIKELAEARGISFSEVKLKIVEALSQRAQN
ncbi:MAG: 4Fe-4S binding protein [Sphaerochaeta sp.]